MLDPILAFNKVERYCEPDPTQNDNLDLKPAASMAKGTIVKSKASSRQVLSSSVDLSFNEDDFIANSMFDVHTLLHRLFFENTLIPANLSNVPTNFRLQTRHRTFVSNFVSLCIWKHMNENDTWITPSDLDVAKKPQNVRVFNHHVQILKSRYFDEFWQHIASFNIKDLLPERVFNYCKNVRTEIQKGIWTDENPKDTGLYFKFKDLLDRIGFKMLRSEVYNPDKY